MERVFAPASAAFVIYALFEHRMSRPTLIRNSPPLRLIKGSAP